MAPALANIAHAAMSLVARGDLPPEVKATLPKQVWLLKPIAEQKLGRPIDERTFALGLPAMMAPQGAEKDIMTTDGPDQIWFLVVAILCIAVAGLFLIIRIYTKWAVVRSLEIADWFIFVSFPLIVSEIGLGYHMVKWGSGVHQWQVTFDQLFHQLYFANIAQIVYCPLSFAVKMAILLQYLRLFAPSREVNRTMWYGAWFMIVSCSILYTVLFFWTMFYCTPRHAIWDKFTPNLKCHDVNEITLVQGAFNMASDIIILLLPTTGLWKLNVPLRRKVAVTILFGTGLLACIASAMRIVFTVKIAPIYSEADVAHNALFIGLWTEAEVTLGFIVACALCLPKLIQVKGQRIKRAVSKASSPFASLRSMTNSSRAGTWNLGSSNKGTKLSSTSSITSLKMKDIEASRPGTNDNHNVRRPYEQNTGRLDPNAFKFPQTAASSTYSTSPPDRDTSSGPRPPSLHVPRRSLTHDADLRIRSPTYRTAAAAAFFPEHGKPQNPFEDELKDSMAGAFRGVDRHSQAGHAHMQ